MAISPAQRFAVIQTLLNETWPPAATWESQTDFPADGIPCQDLKLRLKPPSCSSSCRCPKRGPRAPGLCTHSGVGPGSCGSRGVIGCPGSGSDLKLQRWDWG